MITVSFPQMEDDVEVELELEKQVKLMKDEYHDLVIVCYNLVRVPYPLPQEVGWGTNVF